MKRMIARALIPVAVVVGLVGPVVAKGPTIKLTIDGPGLPGPIEVAGRDLIAGNVWNANFIDWSKGPAAEPTGDLPRYVVQFHVQPPRSKVRMMYVVHYVWNPATGRAVVHLPGRGDEWYRLNISSIIRDGQDGKWYHATDEWGRAIRGVLPPRAAYRKQ